MATIQQRATAIIEAAINGVATTDQKNRISAAFMPTGSNTTNDSSAALIASVKSLVVNKVKYFETTAAAAAIDQEFTDLA